MPANTSRNENNISNLIIKAVICGLISSVLYFVMIAVFTAAALKSGISASSYMPAGFIIGAITGFTGGFIIARLVKIKGALYGLLNGGVQALICAVALFVLNGGSLGKGIIILSGIIIGSAIAGGVAGVNLKMKKKY